MARKMVPNCPSAISSFFSISLGGMYRSWRSAETITKITNNPEPQYRFGELTQSGSDLLFGRVLFVLFHRLCCLDCGYSTDLLVLILIDILPGLGFDAASTRHQQDEHSQCGKE